MLGADQVHSWRWRNRIGIAEKAAKRLKEMTVSPKVLPKGFLIPLLESAGDAEDESLQDMWASLLAEGVRSDHAQHAAFRKTLESLSAEDAKWLTELARYAMENPLQHPHTQLLKRRGGSDGPKGGSDDMNGRLLALGLLSPIISQELSEWNPTGLGFSYELADYARQFLAVVGKGEFPWPSR